MTRSLLPVAAALLLAFPALPQGMVGTGAKPRPSKPLPPGLKAPLLDFRDIAPQAGLTAIDECGGSDRKIYVTETLCAGVALVDYDNDGLLDILFVTGDRYDQVTPKPSLHLYRNLGNLKFEDVTEKAGLGHTGWGQGVCAGDIDNDGFTDIFITQWGQNVLLHNLGNGVFRDEAKQRGLAWPKSRWSTGCAFLDYDHDGDLDLFVSNYVDFDQKNTPKPGDLAQCLWKSVAVTCGPRGLAGESMTLFRNDGKGNFTDVSDKAGITTPKDYYGLTVLAADFDNDGWPDVFVACDSTPSLFFQNKGDGTFEEAGVRSGAAYNENGQEQAGMGASAADYDRDGFLDIIKTNFSSDTPTLYHNAGKRGFEDVTVRAGLAVHTQWVRWGTAFIDVDNDGWKDVFIAAGHVYPESDSLGTDESFRQPRLLYWNRRDGEFFSLGDKAGPGFQLKFSSRGVAIGDLDNDGSMEIVVVNMHDKPSLLKNYGERGNALLVQALTASGRDAIGARVTVTAGGQDRIDEVRNGGYFLSQGDFRLHFGLAAETTADVAIRWPDGKTEKFSGIAANQWITLQQGKGLLRARKLNPASPPPQ
jgi:hypothetical protein